MVKTKVKNFLNFIFTKLYKIEVIGLKNYREAGRPLIIVINHLSFLDALLAALLLPKESFFVMNTLIAKRWYFSPLKFLVKIFVLDPIRPMAIKSVIAELKKKKSCIIFPEGRITITGTLMKIYEGTAMMADHSKARILPIRIDGSQYSHFSRLQGKVRIRWFPKITLTILKSQTINVPKEITGRERRTIRGRKFYDIMSEMMFYSSNCHETLFKSLLEQVYIHGRRQIILEDHLGNLLNYGQLLTRVFVLGKYFSKNIKEQYVGFLLPNTVISAVIFFALQAFDKIPVMLNFSMGVKNLLSKSKTAAIRTVITSKEFIDAVDLTEAVNALTKIDIKILYLEDIAKDISIFDKIRGYFRSFSLSEVVATDPNDTSVILFTSGSEGEPKAIVLSHANIQTNRFQLASLVDFNPQDIVFNALPIFHSFGLTVGLLLPLLSGIKVFAYPTPLHYRTIPEFIYGINATIMLSTSTFLDGYARFAHPYDFYSVRYIFAGAEKLKEETRRLWADKYGIRIFEGYGTTETSPVLTTNTPMYNKPGTVGRFLPGIRYRIKRVSGVKNGGRLIVSGPNVMKGYFLSDKPQTLSPLKGEYDTGDIVTIDDEGYVCILDRLKRFAKVAGEMIPLTSVEQYIHKLWPDWHHAVLAVPDSRKGEILILVTNNPKASWQEINNYAKAQGIGVLLIPRDIKIIDKIPLLGNGKTDYVTLQKMIQE